MVITGSDFEVIVKPFFEELFQKMGYLVLQVRKQDSGDQKGFDISISFMDECNNERQIFIECKYYTKAQLNWADIFNKQFQLHGSNHNATGFILLSPLKHLSNIDSDLQNAAVKLFQTPVDFWTPDNGIEELFKLEKEIYEKVFDKSHVPVKDDNVVVDKFKALIESLIKKKELLKYSSLVRINNINDKDIIDDDEKTTLDEKLDSILSEDDPKRIVFHKQRMAYKIFLNELEDVNDELRLNILSWQEDLKIKADRLTNKFSLDITYRAENFFFDFIDIAEKELLTFYQEFSLKGDKQKLLHGVVFELAAQCPLDWR